MNKYEITKRIEEFAALETQEDWDCSGWAVDVENYDEIRKVMLCLTVTEDVIKQAKTQNCDMIISHHPMFYIPLDWFSLSLCERELSFATRKRSNTNAGEGLINIYCAHTNLDKAQGGTTDTLIDVTLNLFQGLSDVQKDKILKQVQCENFLRIIKFEAPVNIKEFSKAISQISPNARIINNNNIKELKNIAFCAGSGSEFIKEAQEHGADCLVTGDLKFHTALDSPIVVYDVGHFESEVVALPVFENLIKGLVEVVYAKEHSPFSQI